MKLWIPMLTLLLAVTGLCIVDGIHTTKVFNKLEQDSQEIYKTLIYTEITDPNVSQKIWELNDYWTKKWTCYAYPLVEKIFNLYLIIFNTFVLAQ